MRSTASTTKSDKNSAALFGFSLPQNRPTTKGFSESILITEHKIGHKAIFKFFHLPG